MRMLSDALEEESTRRIRVVKNLKTKKFVVQLIENGHIIDSKSFVKKVDADKSARKNRKNNSEYLNKRNLECHKSSLRFCRTQDRPMDSVNHVLYINLISHHIFRVSTKPLSQIAIRNKPVQFLR